ncbi:MAG TPA: hypothetical protein VFS09_10120 [Candidatus Eisenbacteria bacterium]|nr:hypothetical protein [Candidatus Eisenbacteria bacterium]
MLSIARVLFLVGGSIYLLLWAVCVVVWGFVREEVLGYVVAALIVGFAPLGLLAVLLGWVLVGVAARRQQEGPGRRDLVMGGIASAPAIGFLLMMGLPLLLG